MDKVAELLKVGPADLTQEVNSDAVQLMLISTFNGLCQLYPRLAAKGLLSEGDIRLIHELMARPLDHKEMIDDPTLVMARESVDDALSEALAFVSARRLRPA
ncbi:MAG: hypothetical protein ACTHJK_06015 [Sphingomicrobium sp.]